MGNFRGPAGWLSWSRRSATESDDLSLIPGTHMAQREREREREREEKRREEKRRGEKRRGEERRGEKELTFTCMSLYA